MKWILLILFPLVRSLEESFQGDVLCSVSDYVKVGLEFEACYKSAFSQLDLEKRPCKTLKKVVERCADTVKVRLHDDHVPLCHRRSCEKSRNICAKCPLCMGTSCRGETAR